MERPRRGRGDWRGPVVRRGCAPARRRRARAGNPGPRRAVRALFAETGRYQPAGLERRDGAAGGRRGLRALRAQAAGLTPLSEKKMTDREQYTPGPASGAQIRKKDGQLWTLVLVRELRHSPEKVWQALTDPAHLREWAPFDADGSLGTVGAPVSLTWVGTAQVTKTTVTRADAPTSLEYNDIRWELEAFGGGTRLTLWHN